MQIVIGREDNYINELCDIKIKISEFEGPLDLLLHMIRQAKINIYDIPISELTSWYISYIEKMKELNIEIASEFIVMASTLLYIKSRMLLPQEFRYSDEEDIEEDPRKELVNQLITYQKYKNAAQKLKERENFGELIFERKAPPSLFKFEPPSQLADELLFKDITIDDLVQAFTRVFMKGVKRERIKLWQISIDEHSIKEKSDYILAKLKESDKVIFHKMFNDSASRIEVIVTFLAMLELIKQQKISVKQHRIFGEIFIFRGDMYDKT